MNKATGGRKIAMKFLANNYDIHAPNEERAKEIMIEMIVEQAVTIRRMRNRTFLERLRGVFRRAG